MTSGGQGTGRMAVFTTYRNKHTLSPDKWQHLEKMSTDQERALDIPHPPMQDFIPLSTGHIHLCRYEVLCTHGWCETCELCETRHSCKTTNSIRIMPFLPLAWCHPYLLPTSSISHNCNAWACGWMLLLLLLLFYIIIQKQIFFQVKNNNNNNNSIKTSLTKQTTNGTDHPSSGEGAPQGAGDNDADVLTVGGNGSAHPPPPSNASWARCVPSAPGAAPAGWSVAGWGPSGQWSSCPPAASLERQVP